MIEEAGGLTQQCLGRAPLIAARPYLPGGNNRRSRAPRGRHGRQKQRAGLFNDQAGDRYADCGGNGARDKVSHNIIVIFYSKSMAQVDPVTAPRLNGVSA